MTTEKIRESEYGQSPNNFHISRDGDTLSVEITYPNITQAGVKHIFVDQESVRASDGVRLHYDYDRDGWVVEQASRFSWSTKDTECDCDWQEVAFIESWGRAEGGEAEAARLDSFGSGDGSGYQKAERNDG